MAVHFIHPESMLDFFDVVLHCPSFLVGLDNGQRGKGIAEIRDKKRMREKQFIRRADGLDDHFSGFVLGFRLIFRGCIVIFRRCDVRRRGRMHFSGDALQDGVGFQMDDVGDRLRFT